MGNAIDRAALRPPGWRRPALLLLSGLLIGLSPNGSAFGQSSPALVQPSRGPYAAFISEASLRFGVPEAWIRAVMRVESAGNVRAISSAGAMGLMQIMPGTWAELRARHGLGANPYDPRDNILAGTAYLREMFDRYGSPGFLAAYNAGPARYEQHLAGRPLPAETRAYLAVLAPIVGDPTSASPIVVATDDPDAWRRAPLFIGQPVSTGTVDQRRIDGQSSAVSPAGDPRAPDDAARSSNPLFVARSGPAGPR